MPKPTYDPNQRIWCGPKISPLYNPDQGLGQLILRILRQTPNAVTQISADSNVHVTCKEMHDRTIKLVKYLRKCELNGGDMIGLVATNSENVAPIVFACFTLGLPINPLSTIMSVNDIVLMYSKVQPKIIFCDAENLNTVREAVNKMKFGVKIITMMDKVNEYDCVCEILEQVDAEINDEFEFPNINPDSLAAILCSSGSNGFPKEVCLSHRLIITIFYPPWPVTRQSVVYFQGFPIYWLSGFYTLISSVFYHCVRISTAMKYDFKILVEIVNKYNVTVLMLPPFMLVAMLQMESIQPLGSIECLLVGGAKVSDFLCEKFKPFVPNARIFNAYMCTEQGYLAVNFTDQKYGSSGHVFNNVEIKIIDENGVSLGPNEKGEICSKIPVQFSSYFNDLQKSSKAFDGYWFKTGDIGYFDNQGFLYVIDRIKELLIYNGVQVDPIEVEAIIYEIHGVVSSCIVGVPEPHTGNDIIHAFVNVDESSGLNEYFIKKFVNEKVDDAKKIRGGVHIVESFPLGMTGKIDRKKVREMALNFIK